MAQAVSHSICQSSLGAVQLNSEHSLLSTSNPMVPVNLNVSFPKSDCAGNGCRALFRESFHDYDPSYQSVGAICALPFGRYERYMATICGICLDLPLSLAHVAP